MLKKLHKLIAVAGLTGALLVPTHSHAFAETVKVKKGDTLWGISQRNNVSITNVKKWNHLQSEKIYPGQVLKLNSKKQSHVKTGDSLTHYRVKTGDTLWGIARHYHVSVSQIKTWNKLTDSTIHPGLNLELSENIQKNSIVSKSAQQTKPATQTHSATHKKITVKATAYTASCAGCSGITTTGINLKKNPHAKVIAVDPSIIPLGSKVYVEGFGTATAADTGGAIKGHRIDVFIPSQQKAINFGVRNLKVTILN